MRRTNEKTLTYFVQIHALYRIFFTLITQLILLPFELFDKIKINFVSHKNKKYIILMKKKKKIVRNIQKKYFFSDN